VPDAGGVREVGAKEKLKPFRDAGNVDKTAAAPVTAVIGLDTRFSERLPKLYPFTDAKAWFKDLPENVLEYIALRNSSLQGAYFLLAARSVGLDCGPMSGFNNAKVDAALFAGTTVKSMFLCNLGYGDAGKLHPRAPAARQERDRLLQQFFDAGLEAGEVGVEVGL
jgi:3-hydroxypropanoate dehydrogenase